MVHSRSAHRETVEALRPYASQLTGVFHCFGGTADEAAELLETFPGFALGIGGVVTFKNAPALREALPVIGLDHILLETDAPWLAPVPVRGTLNESSRIPHICQCIAETLALPMEQVEEITDRAAAHLFSFKNN